jgi:hypothetical protein
LSDRRRRLARCRGTTPRAREAVIVAPYDRPRLADRTSPPYATRFG